MEYKKNLTDQLIFKFCQKMQNKRKKKKRNTLLFNASKKKSKSKHSAARIFQLTWILYKDFSDLYPR